MLKDITFLMDELINERNVPRNVRIKIEDARNDLIDRKQEIGVRVGTAISLLDEISNDINLPVYARTKIWSIVSMLEKMR